MISLTVPGGSKLSSSKILAGQKTSSFLKTETTSFCFFTRDAPKSTHVNSDIRGLVSL